MISKDDVLGHKMACWEFWVFFPPLLILKTTIQVKLINIWKNRRFRELQNEDRGRCLPVPLLISFPEPLTAV